MSLEKKWTTKDLARFGNQVLSEARTKIADASYSNDSKQVNTPDLVAWMVVNGMDIEDADTEAAKAI